MPRILRSSLRGVRRESRALAARAAAAQERGPQPGEQEHRAGWLGDGSGGEAEARRRGILGNSTAIAYRRKEDGSLGKVATVPL